MDSSSVEVRLFVEHLTQWTGAFSRGQIAEARIAIQAMRLRGRWLCADPAFQGEIARHEADFGPADPDAALRALCAFLDAVTSTHIADRKRTGG